MAYIQCVSLPGNALMVMMQKYYNVTDTLPCITAYPADQAVNA